MTRRSIDRGEPSSPSSGGRADVRQQETPYTDGTTHTPMYWPPSWFGGDGINSMSSTPERTLSTSATILDNTIPVVYGERKVVGLCGARYVSFPYVNMGFIFCFGDQAYASGESDFQIQINDEDIDTIGSWLIDYGSHPGDGSQAIDSILSSIPSWSAGDTTLWKSFCHVAIRVNAYNVEMPSALKVTAIVGGRQIDNTWRADGGSSSPIASTNPVEIAYEILTETDLWRGVDSARIDTESWERVAAWCEEDPGDATDRWSYNGIIQWRDPDAAMEEVLHHCFAAPYVDFDGKVRLWADMPPPAITGDWSCSGYTVTEDATSGEATTELSAGDMVYVGSSLRTVASVTDDDTFLITTSATESGVKVRPITGVKIATHNWLAALEGSEANKTSTPDKVVVRWTDPDEWGNRETTVTEGSPDADHYKQVEVTYSGCTNNSMATRLGTHKLSLMWDQPYFWTAVADGVAADLEPGDVFLISDDVLTETPVRLLPPKTLLTTGGYQLNMREFDIGVYTNVTASPITGATPGGGWETGGSGVYFPKPVLLSGNGNFINSDDVVFANDATVYAKETGGTARSALTMNADDEIWLGDLNSDLYIKGNTVNLESAQLAGFSFGIAAGSTSVKFIQCDLKVYAGYGLIGVSGGTNERDVLQYTSTPVIVLGNTTDQLQLTAPSYVDMDAVDVRIDNDKALIGVDNAGTGTISLIEPNASDEVCIASGQDTVRISGPVILDNSGLAWDDLRVSATSAKPGQTNPPGFEKIKDNGAGSTGVFAYVFDASDEEELFFAAQLPHRYSAGTDIKVHVHYSPTVGQVSPYSVIWGLEYTWSNIDGTFGNTTLITGTDTDTFSADEHRVVALGTITGTGKNESSMLVCRVYRDATNSTDDYPSDAALLEVDFHYQVEKLGTEDEYPS